MGGERDHKGTGHTKKGIKVKNILHSAKMLDGTMITPRYSLL